MYVKGVNLGNWLVLEKWMSPGLFDGTTAEDEYYLPTQLPKEIYEERIRMHRSEYITERDFTRIRAMGSFSRGVLSLSPKREKDICFTLRGRQIIRKFILAANSSASIKEATPPLPLT